jgi:hypothetical protein
MLTQKLHSFFPPTGRFQILTLFIVDPYYDCGPTESLCPCANHTSSRQALLVTPPEVLQNKDEATKHSEQVQTKRPVLFRAGGLYLNNPLPASSKSIQFLLDPTLDFHGRDSHRRTPPP